MYPQSMGWMNPRVKYVGTTSKQSTEEHRENCGNVWKKGAEMPRPLMRRASKYVYLSTYHVHVGTCTCFHNISYRTCGRVDAQRLVIGSGVGMRNFTGNSCLSTYRGSWRVS
jgi:hypothetical protein